MINCNDIMVKYDEFVAIDKLSLNIEKNSSCAIVGKSGCGKTTLLHALAGLIKPIKGSITIDGKILNGIRRKTSVILQQNGLFPWKNVWENIALGLKVRGYEKEYIKKEVIKILNELGIYEHRYKWINEISGGQLKRVAIARALAIRPDLLLMDEPTSSLDAITKEEFQNNILQLYKIHDLTMVIVTHDIEEAVFLGNKIMIMENAKIKTIIDNPLFGQTDIKNNIKFYEICLSIRCLLGA